MTATISARRQALAELARARRADGSAGRNLWITVVAVVLLCLMGIFGLWLSGRWSTPPQLLAVQASVDGQIAEMLEAARSDGAYSPDAGWNGAVFELARQVPEAYREQAREQIGRLFAAREAAEVESYFALPPDQRAAELDRRIRAEELRRQARETERSQRIASAGDRGGGVQAGVGGPAPGGRRGNGTEESRNLRRKQYLDKTSAESRARRTEYRRAKDQRRIQLGLVPRT